jgi:glutathione synthase/RimK-type ligase-like ATP-grasp enzyme
VNEKRNRMRKFAHLGILVSRTKGLVPFSGRAFFRRLTVAGARLRLQVYVFAPEWIDWGRQLVYGYTYDAEGNDWKQSWLPLPSLIYDRAFFQTKLQQSRHRATLDRLLEHTNAKLLGHGLPGKLDVYNLLLREDTFKAVLPQTERYAGPSSLKNWLNAHGGEALLKPRGGMHGKGVFRLQRLEPNRYVAYGRSGTNRTVVKHFEGFRAMVYWVETSLIAKRAYLLQPYLSLSTDDGAPFDIRALVQKNGAGQWGFTGAAVRIGPIGGLTSNLHGGGRSQEARSFLQEEYGEEKATDIMRSIQETALAVPPVLERGHGPLLELGIDFGVDRLGKVWVLEVNSKPGRTSFTRLNDKNVGIAAITSPIRYARYVLDRQLGGQINELDVKQDSFYSQNG